MNKTERNSCDRFTEAVSDLFLKHMHQPLTGAAAANGIEAVRSNAIVETLTCRCSRAKPATTMKIDMQITSVQSIVLKSDASRCCSPLYS